MSFPHCCLIGVVEFTILADAYMKIKSRNEKLESGEIRGVLDGVREYIGFDISFLYSGIEETLQPSYWDLVVWLKLCYLKYLREMGNSSAQLVTVAKELLSEVVGSNIMLQILDGLRGDGFSAELLGTVIKESVQVVEYGEEDTSGLLSSAVFDMISTDLKQDSGENPTVMKGETYKEEPVLEKENSFTFGYSSLPEPTEMAYSNTLREIITKYILKLRALKENRERKQLETGDIDSVLTEIAQQGKGDTNGGIHDKSIEHIEANPPHDLRGILTKMLKHLNLLKKYLRERKQPFTDCETCLLIVKSKLNSLKTNTKTSIPIDTYRNGLFEIFNFYINQASFHSTSKSGLQLGNFLLFCNDFGLMESALNRNQSTLPRNTLTRVFYSSSGGSESMDKEQFLLVIDELAQLFIPTGTYDQRLIKMYAFLECHNPVLYRIKLKGHRNPHLPSETKKFPTLSKTNRMNSPPAQTTRLITQSKREFLAKASFSPKPETRSPSKFNELKKSIRKTKLQPIETKPIEKFYHSRRFNEPDLLIEGHKNH